MTKTENNIPAILQLWFERPPRLFLWFLTPSFFSFPQIKPRKETKYAAQDSHLFFTRRRRTRKRLKIKVEKYGAHPAVPQRITDLLVYWLILFHTFSLLFFLRRRSLQFSLFWEYTAPHQPHTETNPEIPASPYTCPLVDKPGSCTCTHPSRHSRQKVERFWMHAGEPVTHQNG